MKSMSVLGKPLFHLQSLGVLDTRRGLGAKILKFTQASTMIGLKPDAFTSTHCSCSDHGNAPV